QLTVGKSDLDGRDGVLAAEDRTCVVSECPDVHAGRRTRGGKAERRAPAKSGQTGFSPRTLRFSDPLLPRRAVLCRASVSLAPTIARSGRNEQRRETVKTWTSILAAGAILAFAAPFAAASSGTHSSAKVGYGPYAYLGSTAHVAHAKHSAIKVG